MPRVRRLEAAEPAAWKAALRARHAGCYTRLHPRERMTIPMKRIALLVLCALCTLPLFAATKVEDDLQAALTAYRQALVKKDLPALEKIWTDDYTFIDSHGRVMTKADRLADLRS